MRKTILVSMLLVMVLGTTACSPESDIPDQVANVVQAEDEHVLSVKNATNSNYPDKTYGETFDAFFGSPTWKYFKGTKEGTDEDGDGKPDTVEEDVDIVEFTGYCTYQDVEVKARIQFTLNEDDTFTATYLSFNEVPQNMLILAGLMEKAFTNGEADAVESSTTESAEKAEEVFHVGDVVETDKVKITFLSCQDYISDNKYSQPATGNKYVRFEFEFENLGEKDISATIYDFSCYADGYAVDAAYFDDDLDANLSSGKKTIGAVYYEVPQDSQKLELEYETDWLTDEKVLFESVATQTQETDTSGIQTQGDLTSSEDYILPQSDSVLLTDADIAHLSLREINYAKNEIYARHGRIFSSWELQNHFLGRSWYAGTIPADEFDQNSSKYLSEIERKNAAFLAEVENARGPYQLDSAGAQQFDGVWDDTFSQRCHMEIICMNDVAYEIKIDWGSSAWENAHWEFWAEYDQEQDALVYTDGRFYDEYYNDDGTVDRTEIYSDGKGKIYIKDGILYWQDDKEGAGDSCRFEKQ